MGTARQPEGGRPGWWSEGVARREVLLSVAATRGVVPWGVGQKLAGGTPPERLLQPDSPPPGQVAARLETLGMRFLVPGDDEWPFVDGDPDPACAWLFAAGRPLPGDGPSVAVIGGRYASQLRCAVAHELAATLAAAGCAVVSGGAIGCDAAAHRGALAAGGHTIAVLGCGLDVIYPRTNKRLLDRLRAGGGTLVGELPPGAPPRPAHFIPRNRLIAALTVAVVVVEARTRSGSLSTARAAATRGPGRVLAVPGAPWDEGAAGCNDLIRDGATLVRAADDVLTELGLTAPDPTTTTAEGSAPVLSAAAATVHQALGDGQTATPGTLARRTGLAAPDLAGALLELELAGVVARSAGGVHATRPPVVPKR